MSSYNLFTVPGTLCKHDRKSNAGGHCDYRQHACKTADLRRKRRVAVIFCCKHNCIIGARRTHENRRDNSRFPVMPHTLKRPIMARGITASFIRAATYMFFCLNAAPKSAFERYVPNITIASGVFMLPKCSIGAVRT